MANPPFSLEKWGFEGAEADKFSRFRRGLPPRTKGDYAFILHMVETMKPGTGRMAVVVPHGVLFRGAAEGRIRQKLIEENLLDVVIGLPEKLFYGTGIPAAVLVFRKHKADDKVLFIDASRDFEAGKNQNLLREADLQRILATCRARQTVAQVRPPRHARRDRRERLQPQHPPLRRHLRGRGRDRPDGRAPRTRAARRPSWRGSSVRWTRT